jgi:hypothetical protein
LLETWKILQECGDLVNCMEWATLFVSIWRQTFGGYHVFFVKKYFSRKWKGFLNVYLVTYIYYGEANISLFLSKELNIGGISQFAMNRLRKRHHVNVDVRKQGSCL